MALITSDMVTIRRNAAAKAPHLETAESGNTADSHVIASFKCDMELPVESCVINIPYSASGLTKATFNMTGKNLLRKDYYSQATTSANGYNIALNNDGTVTFTLGTGTQGTATYYLSSRVAGPIIIPQGNFMQNGRPEEPINVTSTRIGWNHDGVSATQGNDYGPGLAINVPDGQSYSMGIWLVFSAAALVPYTFHPMMRLASENGDFEPYNGTIVEYNWSSTAGTIYGGTLDVISGVLTSKYAADGSLLATPNTYQLTATPLTTRLGSNNAWCRRGTCGC